MFYYIRGKVARIEPGLVVLDANGVGYAIFTSFLSASQAKMGEEATFYTWLYVREDVFDLYGFYKPEELSCFKLLLTVSGVGPKAAVAILGQLTPAQLAAAVAREDIKTLSSAPGIGKKLALRLALELKDKMGAGFSADEEGFLPGVPAGAAGGAREDALEALTTLGYSRMQAIGELSKLKDQDLSVDEIIRRVLKGMY